MSGWWIYRSCLSSSPVTRKGLRMRCMFPFHALFIFQMETDPKFTTVPRRAPTSSKRRIAREVTDPVRLVSSFPLARTTHLFSHIWLYLFTVDLWSHMFFIPSYALSDRLHDVSRMIICMFSAIIRAVFRMCLHTWPWPESCAVGPDQSQPSHFPRRNNIDDASGQLKTDIVVSLFFLCLCSAILRSFRVLRHHSVA